VEVKAMANKIIPVLGADRLSQDADESTSIERQTAGIEGWAALRTQITGDEHRVIKITEDTDVSGAVSPFDRAGLGPYLRTPLLDTWQVLVVYRLDRLTRSIADFEALWKFLEANGKTLVSVSEQIDFGTPAGRLMARQLVLFAEYEREMIRARIKNAYDAARANGKYPGMQFPFGYMPVKLKKGWALDLHPVYSLTVAEIAQRLIAGESLSSICRWLDAAGIPTPRNAVREYKGKKQVQTEARWNTTSLTAILKSPAVIGESTVDGKTLRDDTGMAVKRAEPLIDRETWEQVKSILADNAARVSPTGYRAPLLHVAHCAKCETALNITSASWNGKQYRYYRCPSERLNRGCDARRIPADRLEGYVQKKLLATLGNLPIPEVEIIPAHDNSTKMAELAEAIGALASQIELGRAYGHDVSSLEESQRIHRSNLAKLAQEPRIEEQHIPRATGETWAARWARLDWNGRNELMRKHDIRVEARQIDGKPYARMSGAADIIDYHNLAARGIKWSAEEAI
jgi:site-specific DNA recombinase